MNQSQRNRQLAINYAILNKLVQDSKAINAAITKANFEELLDVKQFYFTYFSSSKFVQHFPQVLNLLNKETETAFARLKPRVRIITKYDESYPIAILQGLLDEAPMFLYACGDITLLDRKLTKLNLICTSTQEDKLINECTHLIDGFNQSPYVMVFSQQTALSRVLYYHILKMQLSSLLIINHSLTKSIFKNSFYPCNQADTKHMILSAIAPGEEINQRHQFLSSQIACSLSKVSILLSNEHQDLDLPVSLVSLKTYRPLLCPYLLDLNQELIVS
ncbi:MAG: hypothetical protein WCI62_00670, partial [Erysipelotrichaceae bacterium]